MGRVKPNHDPLRTVLTPIASAVILLILTGWVGLAHKPEPEVLNGTGVVPAIREALRMIALLPSELHQDLLQSLGSTLLTLALSFAVSKSFNDRRPISLLSSSTT